jgi:hypothetical protein
VLERGGASARVARLHYAGPVLSKLPGSKATFLRLAEDLFDEGALNGPYDERTEFGPTVKKDDPGRGLAQYDPGPARLGSLIMMASLARELGHPRADDWRTLAAQHLNDVPPTALSPNVQAAWQRLNG